MANAPFPINKELTQIALAYKNEEYIADAILPRVTVGKQEFSYLKHTKADRFTVPDTNMGRKSRANEVEFSAEEVDSSTRDYGLAAVVPQADIDNDTDNQVNPLGSHAEGLTDLVLLDREIRVATMVLDAANYAAANKTTLVGNDQWSDFTNSDPIDDIMTALDACFMRPNNAVFGHDVWTKLRQHPKVIKATNKNSGDVGLAARQAVAELLELQNIIVGMSRYNSAKPGQTASYGRAWGKSALFFYKNPTATPKMGLTFGMTAQWGGRVAKSKFDDEVGLRGATRLLVGESVKEVLTAPDCAYLISAAIA